ncbi:wall-associated receptor kinase 3-like [Lolium rigidum]|uniref:wall-associated receptor kinase 3-like n=1 Tax=Lolium rigidum TaxID=89674 RepID=UPI001F5D20EC|nr:wall-associated receptor kinase 3-like [Lolium rigidum]
MGQTTLSAAVIIAAAALMLSAGVRAQVVDSSGTSCGGVTPPFRPARYNQLGLNLTCDRTSNPPRLFLGGSGGHSIRVVDITLRNATGAIVNTTSQEWSVALHVVVASSSGCPRCSSKGHSTGLIIGLSTAIGTCLLLLFLCAILLVRKVKERRVKILKQNFFGQNRGQLLRQLASHKTGMAERMIISLEELQKATNNFDETRQLSVGGNRTVHKGILSDLHVVAIMKSNIMVHKEIEEFINEVAILSQVNHRNIVKLFGCCLETETPLLVYEFISNGTLSDYLHSKPLRSISWVIRLRIATEIAKAIGYLHYNISVPIIHRDIKSPNILFDETLTSKVSGFGASRYTHVDRRMEIRAVQGTRGYFDPTYYYTGRLTEKSDVYSFGVILIELLTRKIPTTYVSSGGDVLVVQFVALFEDGDLVEILDPQVLREGGDDRPTMRQVEMLLEGLSAHVKRE